MNLGTLELRVNRFTAAEGHYRKTESIHRDIIKASPNDLGPKEDLADTSSWLGEIASLSCDINAALSWFSQEYELRTLLVSLSNDMNQLGHLANTAILLGQRELLAGQINLADQHFNEAFRIARRLVEHDEENARWKRLNAISGISMSQIAAVNGELPAAIEHIDAASVKTHEISNIEAFQVSERYVLMLRGLAQKARVLRLSGDARTHDVVKEALASG